MVADPVFCWNLDLYSLRKEMVNILVVRKKGEEQELTRDAGEDGQSVGKEWENWTCSRRTVAGVTKTMIRMMEPLIHGLDSGRQEKHAEPGF